MKIWKRLLFACVTLAACIAVSQHLGIAEDEEVDQGVRRHGFVHNIADDRLVEKVGGIYEPEGLDKYIKRRLDEVNGRLDRMTDRLEQIDQKLEKLGADSKNMEKQ